jgi:hypothetical protein
MTIRKTVTLVEEINEYSIELGASLTKTALATLGASPA